VRVGRRPPRFRLRALHRRPRRPLRRRTARRDRRPDFGRADRAPGAADPRLRADGADGDAVVRARGSRSTRSTCTGCPR
jgi:hypothetical protein